MSDPTNQAKVIFLEALEAHAPEQWPAFLERACGGDSGLRAEVEKLLRARAEIGSFHESPQAELSPTVDQPVIPGLGTKVGSYKLVQAIGEGGMGSVYVAQQTEPVKRLVALKLIKPGLDSAQVIARFQAERQALALMDHPNIARVLDAGTTETSRPFFVMELVKGVPITRYCDENRLTPRERLELFVPVCQAIQHAHTKGIIHRDVKPSNVLVASYDGKPIPKVIDFGIAKATGQQLTEHTLLTGFGAVVGTLEYMSPEQAEFNQLDIDTRSDVYSLGVLLYELLTGTTPLERKRLKEAVLLEVLRMIREEEPPRPSLRLSDSKESLPSISAQRRMDPARLTRVVRGELDWIVLRALEKDRNRRYESASAFAADVQRYLQDEPVLACPPSTLYRLRKFARRHKGSLSAAGLALLGLLGVVGGLAINNQMIRQEQKRTDAARQEEGRRRQQLRLALNAMSSQIVEDWLGKQQELLPEHKRFLEQALVWYEELAQDTAEDPASRSGVADAQARVGQILWLLGQHQAAEAANRRAVALYQDLAADFSDQPEYRHHLAQSQRQLGRLLWLTGRTEKAETAYNDALAIQLPLAAQYPANTDYLADLASTHFYLGNLLQQTRRLPAAEAAYQEALALQQHLREERPDQPEYRQGLARSHVQRGNVRRTLGQPRKAEEDFRAAVTLQEELDRQHPNVAAYREELAESYKSLGNLYRFTNRPKEAAERYRAAIAALQQLSATFPTLPSYRHNLATGWHNLGELLRTTGAPREAVEVFQSALEVNRPLADAFPAVHSYRFSVASILNGRGMARHGSRDLVNAEADYRAALEIMRELTRALPEIAEYQRVLAQILNNLGAALAATNRPQDAQSAFRDAITAHEKLIAIQPGAPDHESELSMSLGNLATLFGGQMDWTSARPLFEQAIDHQRRALAKNPRHPDYLKRLRGQYDKLGDVLVELKDHKAAAATAQEWSRAFAGDAAQAYDSAALLAQCVPLAEKDTRLPEAERKALARTYGDQAVNLLRQALAGRARKLEQLKTDRSFAALRSREDFQKLLRDVAAAQNKQE